ncbi:hypothetical protein Scep_010486 [Stephania cephalantha]|uniref:Uncharacterized protein n=1 Tax=Stephania cephalantha TaxID=152367 RepID=A0AAP0JXD6_9MAGN
MTAHYSSRHRQVLSDISIRGESVGKQGRKAAGKVVWTKVWTRSKFQMTYETQGHNVPSGSRFQRIYWECGQPVTSSVRVYDRAEAATICSAGASLDRTLQHREILQMGLAMVLMRCSEIQTLLGIDKEKAVSITETVQKYGNLIGFEVENQRSRNLVDANSSDQITARQEEFINPCLQRLQSLEALVTELSNKPARIPPEKDTILLESLNRIKSIEYDLQKTRKALHRTASKQVELAESLENLKETSSSVGFQSRV